ncbi:MAG TPA: DciA family protein [Blastocatellia bacterium]|nr:DciA family protein [Blastocatellia bacterium]
MDDLKRILPRFLLRASESEDSKRQAVYAAWGWASGEMVRQQTAPLRFEGRTLTVATNAEPWTSQLKKVDKQLVFKMNSALGAPIVRTLNFVSNADEVARFHESYLRVVEFSAPDSMSNEFEPRLRSIENSNLKEQFLRAAGKCLERRAAR